MYRVEGILLLAYGNFYFTEFNAFLF